MGMNAQVEQEGTIHGLLRRLHEFWVSDHNPQRESCVKLFGGQGSYASAGVMAGYVPSGVMVSHKVLLTPESPQDVADAVLACTVGPDGSKGLALTT